MPGDQFIRFGRPRRAAADFRVGGKFEKVFAQQPFRRSVKLIRAQTDLSPDAVEQGAADSPFIRLDQIQIGCGDAHAVRQVDLFDAQLAALFANSKSDGAWLHCGNPLIALPNSGEIVNNLQFREIACSSIYRKIVTLQ